MVAVKEMLKVPLAVGIPLSVSVPLWLSVNVTPAGSAPASASATVNELAAPAWNVDALALLKAGV